MNKYIIQEKHNNKWLDIIEFERRYEAINYYDSVIKNGIKCPIRVVRKAYFLTKTYIIT